MKKADKPVIIINGDNNKIVIGENKSHLSNVVVLSLIVFATATVLAVSHCCPELLADFVRSIISIVLGS